MSDTVPSTFVGIDIGGTNTRLGIIDAHGRVLADRHCPTPAENEGDDLIGWLDHAYHACRGETDSLPDPEAIGVAVPGILEPGRSAVIQAVNLPFIEGLPIRDRLIERTGLVTILDCDTVAAAWGEYWARERQPKRLAYLTIGTGMGAAVLIDGQVVRHTHHTAGHLGHLVCDTSDAAPLCRCGVRGCLEARVSGPALNDAVRAAGLGSSIGDVEVAFQEGDAAAGSFIEQAARYLAIGLLNIAHIYAVDLLIVGGGVAAGLPSLIRQAATVAAASEGALVPTGLRVELAALGDYSGVVGAALLAAEQVRNQPPPA